MKRLLALFSLFFLAGCANPPKPNLVVVGNSITYSGPSPIVDWTGNWGMAVDSADKDFAHIASHQLAMPLSIVSAVALEHTPAAATAAIIGAVQPKVTRSTTLVIELGDNAANVPIADFQPAYDALLSSVHPNRLVCVSTFWVKPDLDAMIYSECSKHGGRYVFIGDVRWSPDNPDFTGPPQFPNAAVQGHPHAWSMAQIGERVATAAL
jgi:hypothetical protein